MGNRAFICGTNKKLGIYVQWNGGMDTISPLMEYCKKRGFSSINTGRGLAQLCTVINNTFDCILAQICPYEELEEDNGVYIINDNWDIDRRINPPTTEQDYHDFVEMLNYINNQQPVKYQLKSYQLKSIIKGEQSGK